MDNEQIYPPNETSTRDKEAGKVPNATTERVVLSIEDTRHMIDSVFYQGYVTALKLVIVIFCVTIIAMRFAEGGTN